MDDTTRSRPASVQFSDTVFALLSSRRRRHVVSFLADRESRISLSELAAEVTARERTEESDGTVPERTEKSGETPMGRTEETVATLHHNHLPRLADAGAITYDAEGRTVTPTHLEELASLVRSADADEY
ncbi:DUF7344 domain-containing protein [Halopelagius fulvigenes]|uniref:DUF7344 domain-containing protein n=1 Tax=Halopelagius fulvigenes TaxID=1198324 RepID=A0ABD5TTT4_9EURY